MPATRTFHLGDVLSVTTGRLVAPGHIAAVSELLEFMAGEPVWTHQLPRIGREAQPALLAQHPQLAKVKVPDDFGPDPQRGVAIWLSHQVIRFGETLEVEPLTAGNHTSIDPFSEFRMRGVPDERIIPVSVEGDSPERP